MEWFVLWLLLAVVVGTAANSRGRSFAGWTLVSILLSPLIALILLVVLPDKRKEAEDQLRRAADRRYQNELLATIARTQSRPQSVIAPPAVQPRPDPTVAISALATLRDQGLITAEEYEAKKTELLGRI
jgi:hypothetical protein